MILAEELRAGVLINYEGSEIKVITDPELMGDGNVTVLTEIEENVQCRMVFHPKEELLEA